MARALAVEAARSSVVAAAVNFMVYRKGANRICVERERDVWKRAKLVVTQAATILERSRRVLKRRVISGKSFPRGGWRLVT